MCSTWLLTVLGLIPSCRAMPLLRTSGEEFEHFGLQGGEPGWPAGGELLACPICFNSKHLQEVTLVTNARLGGTVQLWEWIGDGATTFSY